MSYFVFDMDNTLSSMETIFYFIASLKLKETLDSVDKEKINSALLPESLTTALDRAYKCFVHRVLQEEQLEQPLGILRPGILSVMDQLAAMRKQGIVKDVIIYSNNGHLQSVEFIRDLINAHVKTDLVRDCIHWDHPMREKERKIGPFNKTWEELKQIMIQGNCKAPQTLEPKQVHFFDDLAHTDLQATLGANYHKVKPYTYKASFNQLALLYSECLREADVKLPTFKDYVQEFFATPTNIMNSKNNLNVILNIFKKNTKETDSPIVPGKDSAIIELEAIIDNLRKSTNHTSTKGGRINRKELKRKSRSKSHHRRTMRKN